MKCPKCGSKMTMLFVSWVCDYCNPAQSNSCQKGNSCSGGCSGGTNCSCVKPSAAQLNSIGAGSSVPSGASSVLNYYGSLVPPPPSPSDWYMKYWTSSISISPPTAADGLKALADPVRLFKDKPKMVLMVSPDPNDAHWMDVKVMDAMALSSIGTTGRTLLVDIQPFEQYFPIFIGPPNPNSSSIDGPSIWIFP